MNNSLIARMQSVAVLLTTVSLLIVFQMARVQASSGGKDLLNYAERNLVARTVELVPERGNIYDRYGHLLAGNKLMYELGLDLSGVENPHTIATTLNSLLGMDYAEVLGYASIEYVRGEKEYIRFPSPIEPDAITELEKRMKEYEDQPVRRRLFGKSEPKPSLAGLIWQPRMIRTYPEGSLASNVIGIYPFLKWEDAVPAGGIEQEYNNLLSGTPARFVIPYDPNQLREIPTVSPGGSVILTIDIQLQAAVEEILDKAVASTQSDSGTIVILDTRNGEVLAMATSPRINLNEYWKVNELDPNMPFNRAVNITYEPGSVFKTITMAIALHLGRVTPDTTFVDTGSFQAGDFPVQNWDGRAYGQVTMTQCMQYSLNVCLAHVAVEKIGSADYYQSLKQFGIGQRSRIDLAGEAVYPLRVPGDELWSISDLARNSFGQALSVAPIQIASAITAIANDGKIMAPHVVKATIENGQQRDRTPTLVNTPISAEAARTLTAMLAATVESESYEAAHVEGYKVAGKTGTAEIPTAEGYTSPLTNASFVGWGPADAPRILVYVWLEKPKTEKWGSIVASPVFSKTFSKAAYLLNIPPDDIRRSLYGQ